MTKKRAVVLFSGGLDSTYLSYTLLQEGYEVFPLTAANGSAYDEQVARNARDMLCRNTRHDQLLHKITWFPHDPILAKDTHTELGRNTFFIGTAIQHAHACGAECVGIGDYESDPHGRAPLHADSGAKYMNRWRDLLKTEKSKIKFKTLKGSSKCAVITDLIAAGLWIEFAESVRWCYNRSENSLNGCMRGCGNCPSCKTMIQHYKWANE